MFKKILSVVMFCVFLLSVSALALDYSAESVQVEKIGKEKEVTTGKVYFTKDKWRAEGETDEGEKAITIYRYDKQVLWILMPEEKMYMEQEIPMQEMIAAAAEIKKEMEKELGVKVWRKIVGREKVSGILCDKYKITTKYTVDKKTHTISMYQWISRKYKELIMKTVFEDGSYNYLKNVKFGKQPAYLFEIPKGYKMMTMKGFMIEGRGEEEEEERIIEEVEEEEEEIKREQMPKIEIPFDLPFN